MGASSLQAMLNVSDFAVSVELFASPVAPSSSHPDGVRISLVQDVWAPTRVGSRQGRGSSWLIAGPLSTDGWAASAKGPEDARDKGGLMRKSLLLIMVLALLAAPAGMALAGSHVEVVTPFPAGSGPEGVAVDSDGNIYVSMSNLGEIWKVDPDTGASTMFYSFANPGTFGLVFDAVGKLYAVQNSGAADHGVWRISKDGARGKKLLGSEAIFFPNAMTFGPDGYLYVTESVTINLSIGVVEGSIWRFPPTGNRAAELWYRDADLLSGTGLFGSVAPGFPPIGANGIGYSNDSFYVANSERGTIVAIPLMPDGSPGTPSVVAAGIRGLDGVAFDADGDLWAARVANGLTPRLGQIIRIDVSTGTYKVIATDNNGLANPASIAFGTTAPYDTSVYTTNFALFAPGLDALLRTEVGVAGQ